MIRAVLFDLDGTLCDIRGVHLDALNKALAHHGAQAISRVDHEQLYDGLPTRRKLALLVSRHRLPADDVESVAALKQKYTAELLADPDCGVKFSPSLFCLWAGLRACGIRRGVVTNAVRATARAAIDRLALAVPDVLVTNEDGCEPKPSPAPYLLAAGHLSLPPGDCLVFEDNHYGVRSATEAGCVVVAVAGPHELTAENVWRHMEGNARVERPGPGRG